MTRKGLVVANFLLFISAVMMVAGGDMVMIADILLSSWWSYSSYKYYKANAI